MERLVAGATAGDEAHLALLGYVAAVDDLVVVVDLEVGVCGLDPEQGLDHDVVRVVDELLHVSSFGRCVVGRDALSSRWPTRDRAPRGPRPRRARRRPGSC